MSVAVVVGVGPANVGVGRVRDGADEAGRGQAPLSQRQHRRGEQMMPALFVRRADLLARPGDLAGFVGEDELALGHDGPGVVVGRVGAGLDLRVIDEHRRVGFDQGGQGGQLGGGGDETRPTGRMVGGVAIGHERPRFDCGERRRRAAAAVPRRRWCP
ncbi:hypothetical protein [Nonomuraea sp. NPDC049784]|uniref:hypothetical protein n=1 Tax=Nonomuraea sp. NPDC049784 TaxID=3154361 RepID=UPI0033FAD0D0